tara:strand:- start:24729 stop:26033 length:1305 start_codon:yes stop_codon:yes gene_type:complete
MFGFKLDSEEKEFLKGFKDYLDNRISFNSDLSKEVLRIINKVKIGGDKAIINLTNKLDDRNVKISQELVIDKEEIQRSTKKVEKKVIEALNFSFNRIAKFYSEDFNHREKNINEEVSQYVRALQKVLIYAPGGKASYPSTVLMASAPAKAAGVNEIYLTTPFMNNKPNDLVLAACSIAGIDKVFSIGGAQAIAAFTYGSETIPRVQKIIGPGNKYVSEAKKLLFGEVGVDMIAGPSELVVVADKTSNPRTIALDLMAQAEHDEHACTILISSDMHLIEKVQDYIKETLPLLQRKKVIEKSLSNYGLLVKAIDNIESISIANKLAPEHLHLVCSEANKLKKLVKSAGAILVGEDSANGLSDYVLGPSHILPTMGTSRFTSILRKEDFLISSAYIHLNPDIDTEGFNELIHHASVIAEAEGLTAHSLSLNERKKPI